MPADTASDPRQPSRLLKKKNTARPYPGTLAATPAPPFSALSGAGRGTRPGGHERVTDVRRSMAWRQRNSRSRLPR